MSERSQDTQLANEAGLKASALASSLAARPRQEALAQPRADAAHRELRCKLADLAVVSGANVQPGQVVDVAGEIGHLELLRAIAEAAYARGARFVDVRINDPLVQYARVRSGPEEALTYVPAWEADRVQQLMRLKAASILVTGPTFPSLFDDLDPGKVALCAIGPSAQWREAERSLNWTIIPGATPGWASRLRPELSTEGALSALWSDLAHACRLGEPDVGAAWQKRLRVLQGRAEWLTSLQLDAVQLQGPGTDLTVGLIPAARWECPRMSTSEGIVFLPNLPTEEVYTTPDPSRVDGHIRLTRPLVIGERRIDDVALSFRDGRVVDIEGPSEVRVLREFTERDSGAARLGELALVDGESCVAGLEQTFGEILLDENAASHIALGHGFAELVPDTNPDASNESDHHLDVMFGSPQIDVTGRDRQGASHALLRGSKWAEA